MEKIIVTGGSGFLGLHICKTASDAGFEVVSISRSGKPTNINTIDYKNVTWVPADIFKPETWNTHLIGAIALIHCIGILEENKNKGITHQHMILEPAIISGNEAEKAKVRKFVFISASAGPPGTPPSYIDNKRKAEEILQVHNFQLAVLRPGMLYSKEKPDTIRTKRLLQFLSYVPFIGKKIKEDAPLNVELVAKVALQVATDDRIAGILQVKDINTIAKVSPPYYPVSPTNRKL